MSIIRGIVISGAALATSGIAVHAADLYGGRGSIKDDYVVAPQARGCGAWYGRVDFGYSSFDKPNAVLTGVDDYIGTRIDDTWSFGGGIGRYLSCNLRADLTIDRRYQSDVSGTNANIYSPVYGRQSWGYESTAYLANLYYDFDTRSRFTPYVGVGVGFAHNQFTRGRGVVGAAASFNTSTGPIPTGTAGNPIAVAGDESIHAAAALMTGFSVALRDRLSLDAGYRFLYLGQNKTGQSTDPTAGTVGGKITVDSIHAHEVRVGLRYDFN